MEKMSFLFQVILYVGIGLPLVNLLLGALSSAFGGGGADAADLDAGTGADLDLDIDVAADVDIDIDFGEISADIAAGDVADIGDIAEVGQTASASPAGRGPFVQFNLYCLCLAMVIFGAMGVFAGSRPAAMQLPFVIAGGVGALLAYILLYRLVIYPLRKNDPKALNINDLAFKHAVVIFRITADSPGKIVTKDAVGATISYIAEMDTDICKEDRIAERQEVIITEIDRARNVCKVTLAQHKLLT